MISNYERTGIKGLTENTAKTYITRIKVVHRELSKTELNVELLTKYFRKRRRG